MANQFEVSIDDLGNWVFIDRSDFDLDCENDSVFEVESLDLVESIDSLSFSYDEDEEEKDDPINDIHAHDGDDFDDDDDNVDAHLHDGVNCNGVIDFGHQFENSHLSHVYDDDGGHDDGEEDDDDDDDDDDDGYDVDDELVPWDVKDRFERQRIRKLGKRAFAKMTKSKKSVLLYTKPGCVRGKHGLGLKAY